MIALRPTNREIDTPSQRRIAVGLLNFAHAMDHFVILIHPTVIIQLGITYDRSYSDLILLGTAAFAAFGIFSLPAGWLADRWCRKKMMVIFYLGSGCSLLWAAFSLSLNSLACALFALGVFAAIYHPVGLALILTYATRRSRTFAFNAACGNIGVAFASGISASLTAAATWRAAFLVPGTVCLAAGVAYYCLVPGKLEKTAIGNENADVALPARTGAVILLLFIAIALGAGLVVNTVILSLPKIVDERLGNHMPFVMVGGLTTVLVSFGAVFQIVFGRFAEYVRAHVLFLIAATMQFLCILWATYATGLSLLFALAGSMSAIFAQITVNDLVIARYTANSWRGRAYALRYMITFVVSGVSASILGLLYEHGGLDLVLGVTAAMALGFLILVFVAALAVYQAENAAIRVARTTYATSSTGVYAP